MIDLMHTLRLPKRKNWQDLNLLRCQVSLPTKALLHILIDDLVVVNLLKLAKPEFVFSYKFWTLRIKLIFFADKR